MAMQGEPAPPPHLLLEARDIRLALPGKTTGLLSLTLAAGEVLEVRGPSGCGKSTLLRVLSRLSAPAQGELRLRGEGAGRVSPSAWRRQVAFLPQRPVMLQGDVLANLGAGHGIARSPARPADLEQRAGVLLQELGLAPSSLLRQDARTLSGGEAARVAVCRALLTEPSVLLLDEPTASLDLDHALSLAALVQRWLEQGERGVVLVAHDPVPWGGVQRLVLDMRCGGEVPGLAGSVE